jgi:hypothetical protein
VKRFLATLSFILSVAAATIVADSASAAIITFPVIGPSSFSNDYKAPRANGCHCATDIIADKGQQIVSATDGVIDYVTYPEPSWGFAVIVRSTAGNYYWYLHINNDTPGTDDGKGGGMHAFAPDIKKGNPIKRGQLIGWIGDSGNSENTVSHLHFEIHDDSRDGPTINPYNLLKNNASRISKPVSYPSLPDEIVPYGVNYMRKVNVARADVTGDGQEELITGAEGSGSSPRVHVYDPITKRALTGFHALDKSLRNGVDVAAGDIDGDGKNEIVTGLRAKNDAKIGIYRYDENSPGNIVKIKEFVAYTGNNAMRVSTGDINGDGKDEIITGTGPGAATIIRIFDDKGIALKTYRPIAKTYKSGIDIAAGDLINTQAVPSVDEIVAAPLADGSSRTMIFDATQSDSGLVKVEEFYAYGSSYRGGIRLSVGEVDRFNPGYEIATIPSGGARSVFRAIDPKGRTLQSYIVLEEWWIGDGYDIAASRNGTYEYSLATGGNRRASVR